MCQTRKLKGPKLYRHGQNITDCLGGSCPGYPPQKRLISPGAANLHSRVALFKDTLVHTPKKNGCQ